MKQMADTNLSAEGRNLWQGLVYHALPENLEIERL